MAITPISLENERLRKENDAFRQSERDRERGWDHDRLAEVASLDGMTICEAETSFRIP